MIEGYSVHLFASHYRVLGGSCKGLQTRQSIEWQDKSRGREREDIEFATGQTTICIVYGMHPRLQEAFGKQDEAQQSSCIAEDSVGEQTYGDKANETSQARYRRVLNGVLWPHVPHEGIVH